MKKLLLSMAAVALMGASAAATSVTFDFTENSYGLPAYSEDLGNNTPYVETPATITQGDVSIVLDGDIDNNTTAWRMWNDGLREYNKRNPSFTVSVKGTNVTGVEWTGKTAATFALEGTTKNITAWSGDAESVTFVGTASSNAALYTITVYYDEVFDAGGEVETPEYSVAKALEALADGDVGMAIVYGVVTSVGTFNSNYGSLTYNIGDELDDLETIRVYAGLGLNGEKFTSSNDVVVGAKVQVKGELINYKDKNTGEIIPEMDMNSIMLSYQLPDDYEEPAAPEGVLSVAEAYTWMDGGYSGPAQVKGIITEITEVSEQYGNATYTIKDSETATQELVVFRGYYLEGEKFTSEDQIEIGNEVIVEGNLQIYSDGTYEITNSKILELNEEAGVESIGIDLNAPATYYNLQGMKVNNPLKGQIYVVRQGNKTVKVVK